MLPSKMTFEVVVRVKDKCNITVLVRLRAGLTKGRSRKLVNLQLSCIIKTVVVLSDWVQFGIV